MNKKTTNYALILVGLLLIILLVRYGCGSNEPPPPPPPPKLSQLPIQLPNCGNYKNEEALIKAAIYQTMEFGSGLTNIVKQQEHPDDSKKLFMDWEANTIQIIPAPGWPEETKTVKDYLFDLFNSPCRYEITWLYDDKERRASLVENPQENEYVVEVPIMQKLKRYPCPEAGKPKEYKDNTEKTVKVHIIVVSDTGCTNGESPCCKLLLGNIKADGILPEIKN